MPRICVFAGSNLGARAAYAEAARELGQELARRGLGMVYGGASIGLMAVAADAALAAGAEVIGVIPEALVEREVAHGGLSEQRIVATMHERKALMAELSDGFIALPGGFGTLDELFETLTWGQLGLHQKPCGLLDAGGYFGDLLRYLDRATAEGFIRPVHRAMLLVARSAAELLDRFEGYEAPGGTKWIRAEDV